MKIKPSIRPWLSPMRPPIVPPVNTILEMKGKNLFTANSLLYQAILLYGIKYHKDNIFSFTEIGNWLIKTQSEFTAYYSGNRARTSDSAKLANRRNRIEKLIDHLISMELLYVKSKVPGIKNKRELVPLYELTFEGKLLAWIIEGRDPEKATGMWLLNKRTDSDKVLASSMDDINPKRSRAITRVFELIDQFTYSKESFIFNFLSRFFKKCFEKGLFSDIVDIFYYYSLSRTQIKIGQELIRLFTKVNHPLNWIFAYPHLFMQSLDEMDGESKRVLMFNFKLEIEEYYNKYYLISYVRRFAYPDNKDLNYSSTMAIAGKKWQLSRVNNLENRNTIVIPGLCCNCKLEFPIRMDTKQYLNHLVTFVSGSGSNSLALENIMADCKKCNGKKTVWGKIYMPLDMYRGHEQI